ncbi:hypothetical protein FQN54_002877 [Arachnomyces sp. PD_36]|nr:hypothetical protein FQN54_002877 [Arachnomyces sp. PD_36]
MAKKSTSSSPGNDTILGKAKHLVRRFSWDMDDQPPPSNSGDEPDDGSLTTTDPALAPTTTAVAATHTTVPNISLKRSTTLPVSTVSADPQHPMTAGRKERSEDAHYWKDLYSRRDKSTDTDVQTLDIEYDALSEAWKRHQASLPAANMEAQHRTADDVILVIRAAEREWSSSKYKANWDTSRALLNRFCLTLPAHSAILSAFGYGEEYVNLFHDVLHSVIKVSVDHRKVTEDLSRSLIEVDDAIEGCIGDMNSHPPEYAMGTAARLYSIIFLFLQEVLDWYTRKVTCRLLGSLNENLYGDLHGLVTSIKQMWIPSNGKRRIASSVRSGGSTGSGRYDAFNLLEEARIGKVGLSGLHRTLACQNTLTRQLIYDMQQDSRQRDYLSTERADLLKELMKGLKPKLHGLMGPKGRTPSPDLATPPDSSNTSVTTEPSTDGSPVKQRVSKHKITKMELQFASKDMQDFFDNDDHTAQFELSDEVLTEGLSLVPLGEWTLNPRSQIAYLSNFHTDTSAPPPATLISAYYASTARKMKIPVISHFCSPSSGALHSNATASTRASMETLGQASDGLLSLGYSIIRQLIDLAPPVLDFDSSRDLSPERFAALMLHHGTLKNWGETLTLIETLLTFAPPMLVLVVDEVECLLNPEDPCSERSLRGLVEVLRKHVSQTNEPLPPQSLAHPSVFKVLFTTSGGSKVLDDVFQQDETIIANNLRVAGPSSQHLKN